MVVRENFWQETPLDLPDFSWTAARTVDQGLVQWLQELNVDSGTIQTVRGLSLTSTNQTPSLPGF